MKLITLSSIVSGSALTLRSDQTIATALETMANYDPLTELANRALLQTHLNNSIEEPSVLLRYGG